MSGNCELGRGLRTREKNATEGGAGRFEKNAPDARAAPPEAHESLIGRKTVEEVPLTGLSSLHADQEWHEGQRHFDNGTQTKAIHIQIISFSQGFAPIGPEDGFSHFPAFGIPLIQATSNLNGPAFLSVRRNPTASTLLGLNG